MGEIAKDGTNRGGRRARAGGKPAPLIDKINAGKAAKILEPFDFEADSRIKADEDLSGVDLKGEDIPNPSDYLSSVQRDGTSLGADTLYKETWLWLKNRNCESFISPRLLESYAQAFSRYIQCEEAISKFGLLGKHPTTGGAIASPFVSMSQSFLKQANLLWYEIFDIVKQNSLNDWTGPLPQDDMMEKLLRKKKGK